MVQIGMCHRFSSGTVITAFSGTYTETQLDLSRYVLFIIIVTFVTLQKWRLKNKRTYIINIHTPV